ncbi:MAG: hypothetical protein HY039_00625 [Nitrospirae bacterium]|nr:hypothetical protein [Nitrospirota bacterium]
MKRTTVGIAVLPETLSASAIEGGGLLLGAAEVARGGDLRADAGALLAALGGKVPAVARGKVRAAIGWGGPSVLAVVETNGAGGKARDAAVRSALEAEAGRSLDGWRIAWAPESGRKSGKVLAGAVPEDELLSVNAAALAAGGEVVGADLLPLVLLNAIQAADKEREASALVVLLPGSVSLFLLVGATRRVAPTLCRHRWLNGGDTEDRAETEILRGLVAWEGLQGAAPKRMDLIVVGGSGRFADGIAEKVAVPVREAAIDEIVRRTMRGKKPADALSGLSCLAVIVARSAL